MSSGKYSYIFSPVLSSGNNSNQSLTGLYNQQGIMLGSSNSAIQQLCSNVIYKQNVSISLHLSDFVSVLFSNMGAIFQLWNMLGC